MILLIEQYTIQLSKGLILCISIPLVVLFIIDLLTYSLSLILKTLNNSIYLQHGSHLIYNLKIFNILNEKQYSSFIIKNNLSNVKLINQNINKWANDSLNCWNNLKNFTKVELKKSAN
ncbi:hypothetical protein HYPBUDRAFT_4916 [Hyphopichia burtonii NRRL Y-1933]|uniref:Uncharacterized protein n=1 Tax=Hyphopichia burtonii NRRL Y-1933 TaxID=984485 RepID=A0A1E4RNL0_9ASCO|nr:hypothetical protein HYPBUDRAFT_4916 [Hyphopichia burtonii NRRL Y-1933]ODV68843.1 hypothetical protein HYPBUDRAFT_4916 [Hyphopichia burtonii NRRL Y-1933]